MKEFIEKLIGMLEEYEYSHLIEHDSKECLHCQENDDDGCGSRNCFVCVWDKAKEIVNQLAEGYIPCAKSSCSECEVYDKEKHYCPKWCEVIKHTTRELAEKYNNDVCEWFKYDYRTIAPKNHDAENPYWRIPDNMDKLKFCPYCGKKIKVVE